MQLFNLKNKAKETCQLVQNQWMILFQVIAQQIVSNRYPYSATQRFAKMKMSAHTACLEIVLPRWMTAPGASTVGASTTLSLDTPGEVFAKIRY